VKAALRASQVAKRRGLRPRCWAAAKSRLRSGFSAAGAEGVAVCGWVDALAEATDPLHFVECCGMSVERSGQQHVGITRSRSTPHSGDVVAARLRVCDRCVYYRRCRRCRRCAQFTNTALGEARVVLIQSTRLVDNSSGSVYYRSGCRRAYFNPRSKANPRSVHYCTK